MIRSVLQIPNYYWPHTGGIEQVSRDLARVLREAGVSQRILCFNEDAGEGDSRCRRRETVTQTVDGVEVLRCGCAAKVRSQSIAPGYPRLLRQTLAEFRPEAVVFHYPNPFVAGFLLRALPPETKLILYWHLDITKQKWLRLLFRSQNRRLIDRADRIVATSPPYISGSPWLTRGKEKCVVIPNCLEESRLRRTAGSEALAHRLRRENPDKILCFGVGRHVPYKGFRYLIDAARQLDDRFVFIIAGSGEESERLRRQAAGDPRIRFPGRVSDEELAGYLTACDIFCFPSITKNEAFGIALAEAMRFGKPAVTFTIPGSGVNYVSLDGETGLEVPNRDAAAYAAALRDLANHPAKRKRLGDNAKKRAEKWFLYPAYRDHILQMLDRLDKGDSPS